MKRGVAGGFESNYYRIEIIDVVTTLGKVTVFESNYYRIEIEGIK
jgi:hypothetical protein